MIIAVYLYNATLEVLVAMIAFDFILKADSADFIIRFFLKLSS